MSGDPILQAGETVRLTAAREVSPHGYFLHGGGRDILLHYSETEGEVRIGEPVEVFLFHDTQDRLAATMKKPLIRLGELAQLEVADVHSRFGCFLEMGLGRQLLLPAADLPELKALWPRQGDRVFVTLAHDKQGRLLARLAGEQELAPRTVPVPSSWLNRRLDGWVYKPLQDAVFLLLEAGDVGFGMLGMLHASERTRPLRLGEQVQVRITFVREDGRCSLSMRPLKEAGRVEDADRILAMLAQRPDHAMPYSDETPADIIMQKFGISKSAFKRAMGKLMKEGRVFQKGSWTHLQAEPGAQPDGKADGQADGRAGGQAGAPGSRQGGESSL